MALKATEVFTPGAFPTHTYVERAADRLESALKDALDTPGQVISISGPSKSGKTVLVEKVVGRDNLITVTGAGIQDPDNIWTRVLDWMDVPHLRTEGTNTGRTVGTEVAAKGGVSIPAVVTGEASAKGAASATHAAQAGASTNRRGLNDVVDEIANSDYVVLVDDFHYMPRLIQVTAAQAMKEAVRLGVKVCAAAAAHRGDDVVRANPELRGRVRVVDLKYWPKDDLKKIAVRGFSALNASFADAAIDTYATEAAGSPQLMQMICLNACFVAELREKPLLRKSFAPTPEMQKRIFQQTSSSTDFRSLVDVLDAGPKTRGAERKLYGFNDGTFGDVYRCILRAISADPPKASFDYEELTRRVAQLCQEEQPVGSSVVSTCLHMSKLALEKFPSERAIDWDEQKQILDIADPYLTFYLRWSGRLDEVSA